MENKIFVGGLSYDLTAEQVKDLFTEFGEITDFQFITDRETGRPKGFAFVTFESADDAKKAIEAMNGKEVAGRSIVVNIAKPREDRPPRRNDFGGGRGGGGYGGGRRDRY